MIPVVFQLSDSGFLQVFPGFPPAFMKSSSIDIVPEVA